MSDTLFTPQTRKGPLLGVENDTINFVASGDNTIVAAVANRKIRIHKMFLVGAGASDVRFWSGPSSENTPKSGLLSFGANFGLAFDGEEFPLETGIGKAFVISSTAAIQCGGWITYKLI
jgi:hypothetical protein